MASANKSETLGLSLWQADDRPERADFVGDNEQLESLVGGHIISSALHLTADEKNYLKAPFKVVVYKGTGTTAFKVNAPFQPALMLAICTDMPPTIHRDDGKTEVYWDLWTSHNLVTGRDYWGMGGIIYDPEKKRVEKYNKTSDTNEDIILRLNDTDKHYAVVYFPELG